jgi:hypothetical protein
MPADQAPEDLRSADLSHLRISEMNPAQKAELRRRYDDFVRRVAKPPKPAAKAKAAPGATKWVPGKKVR